VLHRARGASPQYQTSSPSGLTHSPINRYIDGIVSALAA
jgi:hypothetical protein